MDLSDCVTPVHNSTLFSARCFERVGKHSGYPMRDPHKSGPGGSSPPPEPPVAFSPVQTLGRLPRVRPPHVQALYLRAHHRHLRRAHAHKSQHATSTCSPADRARSRPHLALPRIHLTPGLLTESVQLFLKRQCDTTLASSFMNRCTE